jgi:hypothetical protein
MATYYKVTNVSAGSEKGQRNIFLTEAGKLLKAGETLYNLRRLSPVTIERAKERGLDIVEQSTPFKDPSSAAAKPVAAPKVKHKVITPDIDKLKADAEAAKAAAKAEAEAKAAAEAEAEAAAVSVEPAPELTPIPELTPAPELNLDSPAEEPAAEEPTEVDSKKSRKGRRKKGSSDS